VPESNIFLRWVRLKQASRSLGAEADPTDSRKIAEPSAGDVESDRPFDLASLPSIESIAAHTDIAAFLNTGVPAELTRAALRRAWATDPAIRDFIGIAENQWDFNDPNGIPGFGPLDPTDNAADLVGQLSKGLERLRDVLADVPAPADPVRQSLADSEQPALERSASAVRSLADDAATPMTEDGDAGEQSNDPAATVFPSRRARRHGGALPR
jgi:uncharacterized protein DUF3306